VRIGGMIWFIAGFAFCLVFLDDGIGGLLTGIVTVVGAIVTFVLELGGVDGGGPGVVLAVLVLIGVTLLVGREWTERARGKVDADDAWNKRSAYRRPKKGG